MDSVKTVMQLVFGPSNMGEDNDTLMVPSGSTLSRATYRIDLLNMILMRQQMANWIESKHRFGITLCFLEGITFTVNLLAVLQPNSLIKSNVCVLCSDSDLFFVFWFWRNLGQITLMIHDSL